MPPPPRRLLPPLLAAVLALAVAVPATWYVATVRAAGADPAPVPTGPFDRAGLRAGLLAELPGGDVDGAVLVEPSEQAEVGVGVAPGRYRVHLICGVLRRQGEEAAEVSFFLATPDRSWRVALPCPSAPLTMDQEFDFTGDLAGAVSVIPDFRENQPVVYVLLLRLVPAGGG